LAPTKRQIGASGKQAMSLETQKSLPASHSIAAIQDVAGSP
jgi:hypothetical protein